MFNNKSRKLKAFATLPTCLVLTIMALGLVSFSCPPDPEPPMNRIVFSAGEGGSNPPSPKFVEIGGLLELPDQGGMRHTGGKLLTGWKNSDGETYGIGAYYRVTKDEETLTAQWRDPTATVYTVLFEQGEGSGTPPVYREETAGTIISLPRQGRMTAPSGKEFEGWKGGGTSLLKADAYYKVNGDITFTAQWKAVATNPTTPSATTYTVTYNINGGSGTTPSAQTVTAGSNITLNAGSGLSRSGYTFDGWNTNANGTGTNYPGGTSFTPTASITLYAKWNAVNTYTVTYNINGGSGTTPSAQTVTAGSNITLNAGNGLSRSGYTFDGWNTNANGTGTNYPGGSSFTPTASITLYAKWNAVNTYTVTYNINGGSGTTPSAQTVTAGSNITLNAGNGLSRSGYTFDGWNTNANGTGIDYPAGTSFTPTASITLYAKWKAVSTHTVTYYANGGTGTPPTQSPVTAGSDITLASGNTLSRSGFTFGGWTANNPDTVKIYSPGDSYTVNADTGFYAKWVAVIPAKPTITSINYSERANSVVVVWNAVSWAASYRIYYGSNQNLTIFHEYTPSPSSTSTAYRYTDNLSSTARIVPPGGYITYYYCQVSAVNSDGKEGPRSDIKYVSW